MQRVDYRYIVDFGNLPFTAEINSRNSYVLFQFQILNRFSPTFSSKCLTFDNNNKGGVSFHIISIGEVKISSLLQFFSYKNIHKNNYHLFNPLIKYILNSSSLQVSYSRLKFWKTLFKSESCRVKILLFSKKFWDKNRYF